MNNLRIPLSKLNPKEYKKIGMFLSGLYIPLYLSGFTFLIEIIYEIKDDINFSISDLYKKIGQIYEKKPHAIEHCIRHLLQSVQNDVSCLKALDSIGIKIKNNWLTNKEFISQLAFIYYN